jgi:RNA recognition motif-containing protein
MSPTKYTFTDFDPSVNIDISIDPFTFRNPSYCFVNLQSAAAAQLAMQTLSGQDFRGRPLKVKPCVKKSAKPMGHESDPLVSNRWRPNSVDRAHTNYTTSDQYALSSDSSAPMQDKRRVYVGNLPRPVDNHMSDLEIRDLFKNFVVLAVSKVNWPRGDPTPPGKRYAFVDLASNEEAERAIAELHGLSMWGDHLVVKLVTGNGPKPLDIS